MRIAIIGCGHAGRRHADQLRKIPEARIVACCDSDQDSVRKFADEHGALAFTSLESLLAEPLDGVTVCTPPNTHAEIVSAAIERDIKVLCEKPLAPSVDDCLRIPRSDLLACAFKFRHLSGAVMLRDMIARGELGDITHVRGTATSDADMTGKWFSNPECSGGGVLLDNGVHIVDLVHFVLGSVEDVIAHTTGSSRSLEVEESASMKLRLTRGAGADIFVSWESPAPMAPLIEIFGTRGYARLGYEMQAFDSQRKLIRHASAEGVDIWTEVLANFVSFVAGRSRPSAVYEDGFAAVAVTDAAYRSLLSRRCEEPVQALTV